jgi:hypothetical protein
MDLYDEIVVLSTLFHSQLSMALIPGALCITLIVVWSGHVIEDLLCLQIINKARDSPIRDTVISDVILFLSSVLQMLETREKAFRTY